MAYDEYLADRIRRTLVQKKVQFLEKKMMGGLTFMVNEKMCIGIIKNDLMARIDPDILQIALSKKGCREMDFTGKPMKGYVLVSPAGVDSDTDMDYWIQLCLDFNPKAKSSKKK
ncbi:MAG: TfoX/Sxy family protein [Cyclobacteriaceae bacterium]|nr:TfoX/Sxy family protein [Cyclobacteriaceae bacterium]